MRSSCAHSRVCLRKGPHASTKPSARLAFSTASHSKRNRQTQDAPAKEETKTPGYMQGSETLLCCPQRLSRLLYPSDHREGTSTRYSLPDWPFTHLGGEMLPTHGVFRATGVVTVPPVQVQLLRPVLVRLGALDIHVRVQIQSYCEEWRSSLQSPGQTSPARKQAGR